MKRICITYHMHKPGEDAETCITLPMEDHIANDIMKCGSKSKYLQTPSCLAPGMMPMGAIGGILKRLAIIQGYNLTCEVSFEEVPQ